MQIFVIGEEAMADAGAAVKAWSLLLGVHARTLRDIEARLKAAGLPPLGWYDVLWELERAGGELRLGELAERLVVEPYNATRIVDRLKSEGLLRRQKAEDDKRGTRAVLTDKGRALRRRMWPPYRQAILDLFAAPLSDDDAASLLAAMAKLAQRPSGAAGQRA
jgi:DNA-binding MarR family transcriptional regulator